MMALNWVYSARGSVKVRSQAWSCRVVVSHARPPQRETYHRVRTRVPSIDRHPHFLCRLLQPPIPLLSHPQRKPIHPSSQLPPIPRRLRPPLHQSPINLLQRPTEVTRELLRERLAVEEPLIGVLQRSRRCRKRERGEECAEG